MSKQRTPRSFKIIYSCIVWMLLFSFVHPAFGAWDTLKAEVTFTAQTGLLTLPIPSPMVEEPPTPILEQIEEVPMMEPIEDVPQTEVPNETPEPPEEPSNPADPTPTPIDPTPTTPIPEAVE